MTRERDIMADSPLGDATNAAITNAAPLPPVKRKPRGPVPRGKQWDLAAGAWVDAPPDVIAARDGRDGHGPHGLFRA